MVKLRVFRTVRYFVVVAFFVACAVIVSWTVFALSVVLFNPFAGFDGSREFADISGSVAKRRLDTVWPSSVDSAVVAGVSYKTQWSHDSYSSEAMTERLPRNYRVRTMRFASLSPKS